MAVTEQDSQSSSVQEEENVFLLQRILVEHFKSSQSSSVTKMKSTLKTTSDINLTVQDAIGRTALHVSYRDGKSWKVDMLLHKLLQQPSDCLINYIDDIGLSHFHIVCSFGNIELAKRFLDTGKININARINENANLWPGYTALHMAVEREKTRIVELLLKTGASPNTTTSCFNMTPLHCACRMNIQEKRIRYSSAQSGPNLTKIVRFLIHHGADVNRKDIMGKTPMLYLYDFSSPPHFSRKNAYFTNGNKQHLLLEELLKHKADIDVHDKSGTTIFKALALYYFDGNPTACEKAISIIFARRPEKLEDINRKSCLLPLQTHPDLERKGIKSADIDRDIGKCNSSIFCDYAWRLRIFGKNDDLARFIETGLDINYHLENGKNLLHVFFSRCASDGFIEIKDDRNEQECRSSLEARFNLTWELNARDSTGRTPLHYAILRRDKKDVALLLKLGADLEIVDNEGNTPLNCCFQWICEVQFLVICQLMRMQKLGWKMSERNERGLQIWKRNRFYNYMQYRRSKLDGPGKLKNFRFDRFPSIHELLLKDVNELVRYVRNPMFLEFIERMILRDDYSYYVGLLRLQLKKSVTRLTLIESAKEALVILTEVNFPDICSERILYFLDDDSLKNIIDMKLMCMQQSKNGENNHACDSESK